MGAAAYDWNPPPPVADKRCPPKNFLPACRGVDGVGGAAMLGGSLRQTLGCDAANRSLTIRQLISFGFGRHAIVTGK